ncbi:MAG: hypothetical protein J1E02_07940 [Coprobacter sp.]|nr:hypothetical protein [Coprobacter sp.]
MKRFVFYLPVLALVAALTGCGGDTYRPSGRADGHDYVDLGLRMKWATCNVGADSPADAGRYYAWGEVETPGDGVYNQVNCKTYGRHFGTVGGRELYDVARACWGEAWRMPSEEDMRALVDSCTWTWSSFSGREGYRVTGPSGNSIFLPAVGYRDGEMLYDDGTTGFYWSATPNEERVQLSYALSFNPGRREASWSGCRYDGFPVRPVMK